MLVLKQLVLAQQVYLQQLAQEIYTTVAASTVLTLLV
jgi:hypothetical protein